MAIDPKPSSLLPIAAGVPLDPVTGIIGGSYLSSKAFGGKKKSKPVQNYAPELDQLTNEFAGTDYGQSDSLKNILNNYRQSRLSYAKDTSSVPQWTSDVKSTINQYANTFKNMFTDKVGRPPTSDEYNTFFDEVVVPDQPWAVAANLGNVGEKTKTTLSDYFTTAAQEQAQKKAQEASAAAVAPGSAFDQWATGYRNSISGVEQSLQDFQSRLMERIRPQLLTSLQSQGLLNTGALNEAFAGTAGDLTSAAQNYVAQARGGAEQDIANQKFNLLSLPYQQQQQYTMGQLPSLAANGQNALQNVWNQNAMNQQFNQQNQLLDRQMGNQPSLLQQYGGMILGGTAGGAGQGLGRKLAGGF